MQLDSVIRGFPFTVGRGHDNDMGFFGEVFAFVITGREQLDRNTGRIRLVFQSLCDPFGVTGLRGVNDSQLTGWLAGDSGNRQTGWLCLTRNSGLAESPKISTDPRQLLWRKLAGGLLKLIEFLIIQWAGQG